MTRIVKAGLIQAKWEGDVEKMIRKHQKMVDEAGRRGVQVLCLQELFYSPYFPAEQDPKWYGLAQRVPGPVTERMGKLSKKYRMVLILPVFEEAMTGVYYNTAAIYDSGKYLGKYRKIHIPHLRGFWEKFYFKPGNLGYPVFKTSYGKIGVYICYDRHFPEGARILGLGGAEIVFNPSATVERLSKHLWKLEQPTHAVENQYFVGAINRVGVEEPWKTGNFYGSSYFCSPRGEIIAEASEDKDELVVVDLDLDMIQEVRNAWQFFRDRRPETYRSIVKLYS